MSDRGDLRAPDRAPRKRRTECEMIAGIDPFDYLCTRLGKYHDAQDHEKAEAMALELMPYVKPKLKSIEAKISQDVVVTVRIGGGTPPLDTPELPHDGEENTGGGDG